MLAKPLLADAWGTLLHEKGWFVMCRLNNLPGAIGEIAAGLKALAPHMPALLRDHKKAGQLHKAAWRLVRLQTLKTSKALAGCPPGFGSRSLLCNGTSSPIDTCNWPVAEGALGAGGVCHWNHDSADTKSCGMLAVRCP